MAASDYDLKLEELQRRSVDRLLGADVFDLNAFLELKAYLREKSEQIKSEHVASKQVLKCLRRASQLIESRANYVEGVGSNIALGAEFALLLDIIIWGEAWSDHQPGVPRVG